MAAEDEHTTAIGLLLSGWSFLCCAEHLYDCAAREDLAPEPIEFLAAQSCELLLKAYHRHNGLTLKKLKSKYGHEILKLLKDAEVQGLNLSLNPRQKSELAVLAKRHDRQLGYVNRYINTNRKKVGGSPDMPIVFSVVRKLHDELEPTIAPELVKNVGLMTRRHRAPRRPRPQRGLSVRQAARLIPDDAIWSNSPERPTKA